MRIENISEPMVAIATRDGYFFDRAKRRRGSPTDDFSLGGLKPIAWNPSEIRYTKLVRLLMSEKMVNMSVLTIFVFAIEDIHVEIARVRLDEIVSTGLLGCGHHR